MGKLLRLQRQQAALLKTARSLFAEGHPPVELREAIPYIREFQHKTMVVKIGGSVLEGQAEPLRTFLQDVVFLASLGIRMVLVHGGARQLSDRMRAEGIEPKIIDGVRYTDATTLRLAIEEFNKLNKAIVSAIKSVGGKAIGFLAGRSDLIRAERKGTETENFVGKVTEINVDGIHGLKAGYIPVTTCIGGNGELFNINADEVAAALAKALKAEKLILLTDVDGVKGSDGKVISTLSVRETNHLLVSRVINAGMIPKVKMCIDALRAGVGKVHIINGSKEGALLSEILTDRGIGTEIVMRKASHAHQSA